MNRTLQEIAVEIFRQGEWGKPPYTFPNLPKLALMLCVRFPLSLRNVEDLLHERGIKVSHETVRFWWNRFGPIFTSEIRQKRAQ